MAKRRRRAKRAPSEPRRPPKAPPPSPGRLGLGVGGAIAVAALVVVVVSSALLVDPVAHASFEAPKRLAALAGTTLAAFGVFGLGGRARSARAAWRALPFASRVALAAAFAGLLWTALAAVQSPHRTASIDSLRAIVLYSLLLPLGASRAVSEGKSVLAAAFLATAAVNAAVSLLQSRGIQPFRLQTYGTRNETGAFAGNVGYLALALALAAVLALGIGLAKNRVLVRAVAGAVLLLFVAALVVNRNLTSLLSVGVGIVVLAAFLLGRKSLLPIAGVVAVLALAVAVHPPLRERASEAARMLRAGDWDRLTTYRTGAWAAALEMTRERPLPGWGPASYAAEFVPHRLSAEIRARRRFVNPLMTSSYSEAHNDYLQAFAESGLPGGIAAIAALGALLVSVGRRATVPGPPRAEAAILVGLLVAGGTAALTWFPLQRPIMAVPLLLAAGRAWRVGAGDRPRFSVMSTSERGSIENRGLSPIVRAIAVALVLGALTWPEVRRYLAERKLGAASAAFDFVIQRRAAVEDAPGVLDRITERAVALSPALPGDSRAWVLAGSAQLVAGRLEPALENYRKALEIGERAEIYLNLGRALLMLSRPDAAQAAFVRSVWISPALLRAVPRNFSDSVRSTVEALEAQLTAGELTAPPPRPE